jgi:HlyD family secretion protein
MTANVKILVNQRTNVMKVPNAALRYRPPTDATVGAGAIAGARKIGKAEQTVLKLDAQNKPQKVKVTTGESDGAFTEITSDGLTDGDRLIVGLLAKGTQAASGSNTRRTPGI